VLKNRRDVPTWSIDTEPFNRNLQWAEIVAHNQGANKIEGHRLAA
jgi:hypothetical protein